MREYSYVYTCFWTEPSLQSLSAHSKLLALYLLAGPHTTMLGCFRLPLGYMAEDLRWEKEHVKQELQSLQSNGFIHYDEITEWIWIPCFLTWNMIDNPNQAKKIVKLFHQLPSTLPYLPLLSEVLLTHSKYFEEGFRNRLETLSKPFRTQEKEKEKEKEQEKKKEKESSAEQTGVLLSTDRISIPLNDHSEFFIEDKLITEWQQLYPAVDILQELRAIRGWNLANPKKRKTKSGILKHITQWLSRVQNQGGYKKSFASQPSLTEHNRQATSLWLAQDPKEVMIDASS